MHPALPAIIALVLVAAIIVFAACVIASRPAPVIVTPDFDEEDPMANDNAPIIHNVPESEADDIVTLVDEEGANHDFQVVDVIEVEGNEYALLIPADSDDPDNDEVLVLRIEDDSFQMIDNEEEFAKVVAVLEDLNED